MVTDPIVGQLIELGYEPGGAAWRKNGPVDIETSTCNCVCGCQSTRYRKSRDRGDLCGKCWWKRGGRAHSSPTAWLPGK